MFEDFKQHIDQEISIETIIYNFSQMRFMRKELDFPRDNCKLNNSNNVSNEVTFKNANNSVINDNCYNSVNYSDNNLSKYNYIMEKKDENTNCIKNYDRNINNPMFKSKSVDERIKMVTKRKVDLNKFEKAN